MKIFLARMKKWSPVWIGILAGLGLGVGDIFYRLLTNPNAPPSFYVRPYLWLVQSLTLLVTSSAQRSAHYGILFIADLLGYFIYFAILGALLGLVFQLLLWLFRKLKRPSVFQSNSVNSANASPPAPPPGGQETKLE